MSVEILTKEDLHAFRIQLLNDIKALLFIKQSANMEWLRSSEIRKALKISAGTLQNLRVTGKLKPIMNFSGNLSEKYSDYKWNLFINEKENKKKYFPIFYCNYCDSLHYWLSGLERAA